MPLTKPKDRRLLIEHHERVAASSQSPVLVERARRAADRLRAEQVEEADRLRRIESSMPPESTFEGQLQRRVREKDDELEVVWDGKRGHDGASLSSDLFRRAATEQ